MAVCWSCYLLAGGFNDDESPTSIIARYTMPAGPDFTLPPASKASVVNSLLDIYASVDVEPGTTNVWLANNNGNEVGQVCVCETWLAQLTDVCKVLSCVRKGSAVHVHVQCSTARRPSRLTMQKRVLKSKRDFDNFSLQTCALMQISAITLGSTADTRVVNITSVVPGFMFTARAIRVVQATPDVTHLLIGGTNSSHPEGFSPFIIYPAVLLYGSVAAGSTKFVMLGSLVLPSIETGITALSQTNTLYPGYVLASTDLGVYKCEPLQETVTFQSNLRCF